MNQASKYRLYPPTNFTENTNQNNFTGSVNIDKFYPTNNQTQFQLSKEPANGILYVSLNGLIIEEYNVISNTLNYTDQNIAIETGDYLKVVYLT